MEAEFKIKRSIAWVQSCFSYKIILKQNSGKQMKVTFPSKSKTPYHFLLFRQVAFN